MNILLAPLNWGIGHATRLVPVIKSLEPKHNVFIAADGKALQFLKNEFPNRKIFKAPALNITYTKNSRFLPLKMAFYLPLLALFYVRNRLWVSKFVKQKSIDLIISDNRFGFFSRKVRSFFISHQINIQVPQSRSLEKLVFWLNSLNIRKFDTLLVPDCEYLNVAGKLSDPHKIKTPYYYVGLLSRLSCLSLSRKKNTVLVILSGPEPQRSILQQKLVRILSASHYNATFLTGLAEPPKTAFPNIEFLQNVDNQELVVFSATASVIIARAGYSTITDLLAMRRSALIIPTPGQTEQEYLAEHLQNKKLFFAVSQQNISLQKILDFEKIQQNFEQNIKNAVKDDCFFHSLDEVLIH